MKLAKKILLSLGVLVAFIAYSFQQRHGEMTTLVLPPQANGKSSQTANNSASPSSSSSTNSANPAAAAFKDGSYDGDPADAFYGIIQVRAVIKGGKIADVIFLQYPNDRANSIYINSQAMPYLRQEAIQAQNANVNIITGATDTSQAFIQSLSSALARAT